MNAEPNDFETRVVKALGLDLSVHETPITAIEARIAHLLQCKRQLIEAIDLGHKHCPVGLGQDVLRHGIPLLAERAEELRREYERLQAEHFAWHECDPRTSQRIHFVVADSFGVVGSAHVLLDGTLFLRLHGGTEVLPPRDPWPEGHRWTECPPPFGAQSRAARLALVEESSVVPDSDDGSCES